MLVVMRLYDWSFAQTEYFLNDSLVLRQFCRVYLEKVPDDTTLIRWAKPIGSPTLERLNERAVALARSRQVTRGRKLRVDTTVIETNIHHPSEGALLGDGVRVLSRLLRRAKPVLGEQAVSLGRDAFRSRMRTVRKLAQAMYRAARRKVEERIEALKQSYGRLIDTAQRTQAQAERVHQMLQRTPAQQAKRLARQFQEYKPRLVQGIQQAWRRVIAGEAVPAKEKLLSLFEPQTQIIRRHKAGKAG